MLAGTPYSADWGSVTRGTRTWRGSSARSTRARRAPAASCSTTPARSSRRAPAGARADLPAAGLGRARPARDLARTQDVIAGALAARGLRAARTSPPSGSPTSARRRVVWDRAHRPAACTTRSSGRTRARDGLVASSRATAGRDRFRAATGLPLATYFSGAEAALAARPACPAPARAPRRGDVAVRHDRLLAALEPDRRPGRRRARHRRHEREPHAADGSRDARLGRRAARRRSACRARCCRGSAPRREVYGDGGRGALAGVPIAGILGDQQAALLGQTCFDPGEAKNTYGTGCFLLMNTGDASRAVDARGCSRPSRTGSATARRTTRSRARSRSPGALVQWLRDNLGLIRSADEIEALARTVADNGGVYVRAGVLGAVRAVLAERRARRRSSASRATRTAATSRARRSRPTAYQTRDVLEAMGATRASP